MTGLRQASGNFSAGGTTSRRYPLASQLVEPFRAPDGDQQRHQHRADEQAEETHGLYAADQAEKGRCKNGSLIGPPTRRGRSVLSTMNSSTVPRRTARRSRRDTPLATR